MESFAPAELLTPRGLVRARSAGLIPALIGRLTSPEEASLVADSALLESILRDADAGLEFLVRGGHAPLSRLLSRALDDAGATALSDALDSLAGAAALAMRALPVGWPTKGFPAPACADALEDACAVPLEFDFSSFRRAPAVDAAALSAFAEAFTWRENAAGCHHTLRVLVRLVSPLRARQTSQEDVGFALWPASLPLSRWIVAHAGALFSRQSTRVLEIGAGVGLTGIVAALASPFSSESPPVWLTDFNPRVLDNLARNASLNEPSLHDKTGLDAELAAAASATGEPRLRTARDDWSVYSKAGAAAVAAAAPAVDCAMPEENAPREAGESTLGRGWETSLAADACFDLILGSDMICSAADATGVSALIAARLAPHGVAILLLPPTDVRWGIDALPSAAAAAGLDIETHPLSAAFLAATFEGDPVAAAREANITTASGYEPRARLWFFKHQTVAATRAP